MSEPHVTPRVRRLAVMHGVDLNTVAATGVGGRIRTADVLAAAAPAPNPAASTVPAGDQPALPSVSASGVAMDVIRELPAWMQSNAARMTNPHDVQAMHQATRGPDDDAAHVPGLGTAWVDHVWPTAG